MLYLVKCEVQKNYYMGETEKKDQMHIVEADSEQESMEKVSEHYKMKDSSYSISHWVNFEYANALIS